MLNGKAVLDLNYQMDQNVSVDMNVVMTSDGRFVEVQGTAEGEPFSRGALNAMLLLAEHGIRQLFEVQAARWRRRVGPSSARRKRPSAFGYARPWPCAPGAARQK